MHCAPSSVWPPPCAPLASRPSSGSDGGRAQELIQAGADVNIPNDDGHYPLIVACSHPLLATMVPDLIAHGATVNVHSNESSQSVTPLHGASSLGSLETVDALLAAGADVNALGSNGARHGGGLADGADTEQACRRSCLRSPRPTRTWSSG
jgi:ankyrin repeat protein